MQVASFEHLTTAPRCQDSNNLHSVSTGCQQILFKYVSCSNLIQTYALKQFMKWKPQSSRRQYLKATDEAQARCQYCRSAFTGCLASGGRHDKILLVLTHLVRHAYLGAKGELNFVKWFELVIMYVTYNLASRLLLLGYLFPLYFPCISPYFSAQTKLSGIVTW